ncbi:MAG: competence/damage-inducible protein A [Calditrichia bacterium]|nr:competence/damage-inducible protein A [Calditrichia bacterium]
MNSVKAEIITIGNEILSGWTLNTNAHWIAQKCNDIGLPIQWITTIADNKEEIKTALVNASARAEVILCTGGLGPTPDDITKKTIASFFDTELVLDKKTLTHVLKLFESRDIIMPEINRNQALVPETAKIIPNSLGTAPGLVFEKTNQLFFFMPGVPGEMKQMIELNILTMIKSFFNLAEFKTYLLRTTGIAESRLFEKLEATLEAYEDIPVSFLPKIIGVDIKLKINEKSDDHRKQAEQFLSEIKKILKKYIYTDEEKELEEIIGEILRSKKLSLAIAESFTGGLISDWITDIPGSSDYFLGSVTSYSNESKVRELGVSENTLKDSGAVSDQTALEMAIGVQKLFGADCAIASTGIAGPGGATETKSVGLCFLSAVYKNKTFVKKFNFGANRRINKERGSMAALESLRRLLLEIES